MSAREPVVGMPEDEGSEFLPADLGVAPDDAPEGLAVEETPEEESLVEEVTDAETEDDKAPSPSDTRRMSDDEIIDELTSRMERGFSLVTKRLTQSNRDAMRAQVGKLYSDIFQTLDKLRQTGQLSDAAYTQQVNELGMKIEQKVDEQLGQLDKEDITIRPKVTSSSQAQFNEIALDLFKASSLDSTDPEAQILQKVKLASTLSQSVALYTKELRRLEEAKARRLSGKPTSRATVTEANKSGKAISVDSLTKELQVLMRQSGGSLEDKQKREKRMDAIEALLIKAESRKKP